MTLQDKWVALSQKHKEYEIWPLPLQENGMLRGFVPFSGARVMDIGANIGICTAYCALKGAQVDAYEADSVTFSIFRNMLYALGIENQVISHNKAISDHTGTCFFHGFTSDDSNGLTHNGALTHLSCPDNGKFRIPEQISCVSLDDAVRDEVWDCIKIDVEGEEFKILTSASEKTLQKIKLIYVEFHHAWANSALYTNMIEKLKSFFNFDGSLFEDGEWSGKWDYAVLRNKKY